MSVASVMKNSDVPASRTRVKMPLRPNIVFVSLIACDAIDWICATPPALVRAAVE